MKAISPYQGSARKEIEQLYLEGGRTWIFNPEDLSPEDRDDKWLHRELVQEQISHYRQDYWVVLGYLEIMDPWLDEQGRTVIEVCVTDRLIQAYKCLKQGGSLVH